MTNPLTPPHFWKCGRLLSQPPLGRRRCVCYKMVVDYRLRQQSPEALPSSDAVAAQIWQQITTVIESLDNPAELQAAVSAIRQLSNFNLQHAQVSPLNSLILFHPFKIWHYDRASPSSTHGVFTPPTKQFCLVSTEFRWVFVLSASAVWTNHYV